MPIQSTWMPSDALAENGPDYVALVIEWEDVADEVTKVTPRVKLDVSSILTKVAIGAGALGALLFARWGIHRLRHA